MIDLDRKELILQFFSLLTQDRHVLVSCLPETLNLSHEASSFKKRVEDTNTHTHQSKTKKRKEKKTMTIMRCKIIKGMLPQIKQVTREIITI